MLQARSSAANAAKGKATSANKQPMRFEIVTDIRYLQKTGKGFADAVRTPAPIQGTLLAGKRLHPTPLRSWLRSEPRASASGLPFRLPRGSRPRRVHGILGGRAPERPDRERRSAG